MSFIAEHPGECYDCGQEVKGTPCRYLSNRMIAHVFCPPAKPEKPVEVCPKCFLQLPVTGVCGSDRCVD